MMLTRQQKKLLDFIELYNSTHGIPPTFEEMKEALGLKSKSGVYRLLKGLEERGFIRRLIKRARAIQIVKSSKVVDALKTYHRLIGSKMLPGSGFGEAYLQADDALKSIGESVEPRRHVQ